MVLDIFSKSDNVFPKTRTFKNWRVTGDLATANWEIYGKKNPWHRITPDFVPDNLLHKLIDHSREHFKPDDKRYFNSVTEPDLLLVKFIPDDDLQKMIKTINATFANEKTSLQDLKKIVEGLLLYIGDIGKVCNNCRS